MGTASFVQTDFTGGRWSAFSQGRFDDPRYRKALAECQNMIPLDTHALTRRPGTRHAGLTLGGAAGRLISFPFEDNQPYTMELTDAQMRFWQGTAPVMDPATLSVVSTIADSGGVAVVTLSNAWTSPTSGTTWVQFTPGNAAAAMTATGLFNRQFYAEVTSATTLRLFDAVTHTPITTASLAWSPGLVVTVAQYLRVATPYTAGSWSSVRSVQAELQSVLLQPDIPPQLLTASDPGLGNPAFTLVPALFKDGPYLDPVTDSIVTPDAYNGTVNLTLGFTAYDATKAYVTGQYVTSSAIGYISLQDANLGNTPASSATFWSVVSPGSVINNGSGFSATDVGRHVRLFSEPPDFVALTGTDYAIGNAVKYNGAYYTAIAAITGATPTAPKVAAYTPGLDATKWALTPAAARWTWGKITGLPTTGFLDPTSSSGKIGNMTGNGGLAAAFDGITAQIDTQCAYNNNASAYVGLTYASGQTISSVQVYPSTNDGFGMDDTSLGSLPYSIQLYGKNGVPASATDGTLLGTFTSSGATSKTTTTPVTILSSSGVTTYTNFWVRLVLTGYFSGPLNLVAEAKFYSTSAAAAGSAITVNLLGPALLYTSSVRIWRAGLFTGAGLIYPTCGCYNEGRLWLGGAARNRFDASNSNDLLNMAPTAADGTVGSANAMSYTVNSDDLNQLLWMEPDLQGVIMGTLAGEWLVDSPAPGAMTPTNIRARRMTKYGAANIEPRRTGLTTVFVQRYQHKIIEYTADAFSGKFAGPNLALEARDLVASGIAEIAFQQELQPIVWCRMEDGTLAGILYKRSSLITSQPAEYVAWHKHVLGDGRLVESISSGPSTGGLLDALSMITNDPNTGLRHVSVMSDIFDETNTIFDAQFVDNAVVPVAGTTSGSSIVFSGLYDFVGRIVSVFAAGIDCGDFQVSSTGTVSVPLSGDANGLFTKRWMTQLSALGLTFKNPVAIDGGAQTIPVVIGSTYTSRGQILRPIAQDETGSRIGPAFGEYRRVHKFAIALQNTQALQMGTSFDHLLPVKLATVGGTALTPTELFTGIDWDTLQGTSDADGQIAWQIDRPLPATILAVGGFIVTQEG